MNADHKHVRWSDNRETVGILMENGDFYLYKCCSLCGNEFGKPIDFQKAKKNVLSKKEIKRIKEQFAGVRRKLSGA